MTRFAIIESGSDLVFGVIDANTPIDACRIMNLGSKDSPLNYTDVERSFFNGGYLVHEVPAEFDVVDGSDPHQTVRVERHPLVAHINTTLVEGEEDGDWNIDERLDAWMA